MPRNLIKIPQRILDRLETFDQDDVVAATVKLLRPEDIPDYAGLGLALDSGTLQLQSPAPPPASSGKYSHANLYGRERVRRDLPLEQKEYGFYAPSWRSGHQHYVSWTRDVYPREFFPPKQVNLTTELLGMRGDAFLVKFAIDQVISRRTANFEQELLYNLNLLQENVGAADIFESTTTLAEYAATVRVDWQLLPPGSVDEVFAAMTAGKSPITAEQATVMKQRLHVIGRLKPEAFVAGTDGFLRYFGALFGDDFVVFENLQYGNAIYVMYENWHALSQRSRVELLAGDPDNFERIIHKKGWVEQLSGMVQEYRRRHRTARKLL